MSSFYKYCHILCKYCANMQVLRKLFFKLSHFHCIKYCSNIVQILFQYCTNIVQKLYKYFANVVEILYEYCGGKLFAGTVPANENYLPGRSRQIKNYLPEQSRQIKNYFFSIFCILPYFVFCQVLDTGLQKG